VILLEEFEKWNLEDLSRNNLEKETIRHTTGNKSQFNKYDNLSRKNKIVYGAIKRFKEEREREAEKETG